MLAAPSSPRPAGTREETKTDVLFSISQCRCSVFRKMLMGSIDGDECGVLVGQIEVEVEFHTHSGQSSPACDSCTDAIKVLGVHMRIR